MLGTRTLFWVLFPILHLGLWSIHGEESCDIQLHIRRHSEHIVSAQTPFEMECPVKYCGHRPNVTWCKINGSGCSPLEAGLRLRTSWEEGHYKSIFILHFEPVLPSDNGSYRCSVNGPSHYILSHSTAIHVTEQAQNNSEPPLIRKRKKPSDMAGREINLVDVIQPLRSEQTEASTRQNSQTPPPEAEIYDNDPWFRTQKGSEVYSNPCLEENKQAIVYASLNHSIIRTNPRQARNVKEASTEYASICVRS